MDVRSPYAAHIMSMERSIVPGPDAVAFADWPVNRVALKRPAMAATWTVCRMDDSVPLTMDSKAVSDMFAEIMDDWAVYHPGPLRSEQIRAMRRYECVSAETVHRMWRNVCRNMACRRLSRSRHKAFVKLPPERPIAHDTKRLLPPQPNCCSCPHVHIADNRLDMAVPMLY